MLNFIARIGRSVINFFSEFGGLILLLGSGVRYCVSFKDRRLVLEQMSIVGSDSLPLVVLIGAFTGAIAGMPCKPRISSQNLILSALRVRLSAVRSRPWSSPKAFTPVLTALVIAGRVGGAIAAQIGTMKVSEQIDALEMMAIDRNRYLAMPRVLAALTMMPVLAVFSNSVALVGAFFLTSLKFDFSAQTFFDSVQRFFQLHEVIVCLTKSFVFGGVTSLIGCHVGFATEGGAEGVGNSTVRAFTLSAAAILILDAVFGYLM